MNVNDTEAFTHQQRIAFHCSRWKIRRAPKQDRSCWYQQHTTVLHRASSSTRQCEYRICSIEHRLKPPCRISSQILQWKFEYYSDLLDCISININQIQVKVEATSFFSRGTSTHHDPLESASIGPVASSIVWNLHVEFLLRHFSESLSNIQTFWTASPLILIRFRWKLKPPLSFQEPISCNVVNAASPAFTMEKIHQELHQQQPKACISILHLHKTCQTVSLSAKFAFA